MTGGEFRVTIEAPPEQVWPWVADLGKHAEWSPKPYRVEWTAGEPNAVGSRFRSVGWMPGDKEHVNEGEITENHLHERFALQSDDPVGRFRNWYTLQPIHGGTVLTHRLAFPPMKGFPGVAAAILFPAVGKPDLRKRLQLLKAAVEGAAPRPGA